MRLVRQFSCGCRRRSRLVDQFFQDRRVVSAGLRPAASVLLGLRGVACCWDCSRCGEKYEQFHDPIEGQPREHEQREGAKWREQ